MQKCSVSIFSARPREDERQKPSGTSRATLCRCDQNHEKPAGAGPRRAFESWRRWLWHTTHMCMVRTESLERGSVGGGVGVYLGSGASVPDASSSVLCSSSCISSSPSPSACPSDSVSLSSAPVRRSARMCRRLARAVFTSSPVGARRRTRVRGCTDRTPRVPPMARPGARGPSTTAPLAVHRVVLNACG